MARIHVHIPTTGSEVWIHPLVADPWRAIVVGYTPDGRLRVRSAREDSTTVQTVERDIAVTAEARA